MKNDSPLEKYEQERFVNWLREKGLKYAAIKNEMPRTKTGSNWGYIMNAKKTGLVAGLLDMLVLLPEGKGICFVEMKRLKGGKASLEQLEWVRLFNLIPSVQARVCAGAEEAKNFILEMMAP